MIIDSHTHVLTEKVYQEYLQKTNGSVDKIMAFAFYYHNQEEIWQFTSSKPNLFLVGSIDMDKDIDKQLELCRTMLEEKKIWGIKLYPGYQYFYPSDKKVFPIAKMCQEFGKPLIFHCGDFYDVRGYTHKAVLKYSHPKYVDELSAQFSDCPIIMAHLGFPYILEATLMISKNPNLYADLSGSIDKQNNSQELAALLKRYADDIKSAYEYYPGARSKTLFGTDYSGDDTALSEITPYFDLISEIFSDEEKSQVMGNLAKKIFFS
jgi:predicted TIM-barrel fold metal-dependent hydrolase